MTISKMPSADGHARHELLPTGVPGLDVVLGGGLSKWSLTLIAGAGGAGKTTIAQQIAFANGTIERPAVYFTVSGEPVLKMLHFQRQMSYFDPCKVERTVRFISLEKHIENGLDALMREIDRVLVEYNPSVVVVDSFRSLARYALPQEESGPQFTNFLENVALRLMLNHVATILVGEYGAPTDQDNPVYTITDGILWLNQSVESNSVVRKLQVQKMRGAAPLPGLHTMRITQDGVEVFPRLAIQRSAKPKLAQPRRISTGISALDEMMAGGIPEGDAVLVSGAPGIGKTLLASQFAVAAAVRGEPAVIAVFEEHPDDYLRRAAAVGLPVQELESQGKLKLMYLRPIDLSVEEMLAELRALVLAMGARVVVIDSISGFEMALAPTFRGDFRESLYRLVSTLTNMDVTVLFTAELPHDQNPYRFSPQMVSFLTDDVIVLQYVEVESQVRRVVSIAKMRNSQHSKYVREYEIGAHGINVGDPLAGYAGVLVSDVMATRSEALRHQLTDEEIVALKALLRPKEG